MRYLNFVQRKVKYYENERNKEIRRRYKRQGFKV